MSWFTLWMIVINTSFWLVICFGLAFLVRVVPEEYYYKLQWLFKKRGFEDKLYQFIHMSKWKDKLPEMGKVFNFEKKNLSKELDLAYINQFIRETYYAEMGHLAMAVLGFACILVNPSEYAGMALICSVVNLLVQLPFCLIQRYNRPRLLSLKARLERKHQRIAS